LVTIPHPIFGGGLSWWSVGGLLSLRHLAYSQGGRVILFSLFFC
jgi:hypothetical protein